MFLTLNRIPSCTTPRTRRKVRRFQPAVGLVGFWQLSTLCKQHATRQPKRVVRWYTGHPEHVRAAIDIELRVLRLVDRWHCTCAGILARRQSPAGSRWQQLSAVRCARRLSRATALQAGGPETRRAVTRKLLLPYATLIELLRRYRVRMLASWQRLTVAYLATF